MSDRPPHDRLRDLVDQALETPADQREAFLHTACAGDEKLLDAARKMLRLIESADQRDFLGAGATGDLSHQAPPQETPGERIGRYKLLQLLGEGGFGSVFMAEQTSPVVRRVALKIIKLGMDTKAVIARFEAERQALAMMDHPHIARVLDAGATDTGRPYFVMDLVRGDPITKYCDKHNLPISERLNLFRQVCSAVQHAHQKGIIHRDLKPNNILVATEDGKPHVKVIDFGIAKATAQRLTEKTLFTQHGSMIGTLEYMSPEQADGSLDVDTRSDVYSLGVILYELLTGSTPLDRKRFESAAYAEMQRIIREDEPDKPSTRLSSAVDTLASVAARRGIEPRRLNTLVRGDLDWIVMKALEKERSRRYETPTGFEEDIRRYLDGSAVHAAPPSWGYRAHKFTRKHRGPLAAAGACVLLLIGGVIATSYQWHQARRNARDAIAQRAEAEQRQKESAAIVDFITTDVFARATPDEMPDRAVRDQIVSKMLEPAVKTAGEKFKDQPLVEAAVQAQIGAALQSLGRYAEAESLLRRSLDTRRRLLGGDHRDTIKTMSFHATTLSNLARFAEAEPQARAVYDRARRVLGEDDETTLEIGNGFANGLMDQRRPGEAEPIYKNLYERRTRVSGPDHQKTLAALNNWAFALQMSGHATEAEAIYKEHLPRLRRTLGDDRHVTMSMIGRYATLLESQQRFAEAESLFKEDIERSVRVYGEDHPSTLVALNNYSHQLMIQGRHAETVATMEDLVRRSRRGLGSQHPTTIIYLNNCVGAMIKSGRFADAEPLTRELIEARRRFDGPDDWQTINSIGLRADVLKALNRRPEADALYDESINAGLRLWPDTRKEMLPEMLASARVKLALGKAEEAERLLKRTLDGYRFHQLEETPDGTRTLIDYVYSLYVLKRHVEAEPLAKLSVERAARVLGPDNADAITAINNQGLIYYATGRLDDAVAKLAEVLERRRRVGEAGDPGVLNALSNLTALLARLDRHAEAEPLLGEIFERHKRVLGADHLEAIVAANNYVFGMVKASHAAAAEPLATETLERCRRLFGEDDPATMSLLNANARVQAALGRADRAEALFKDSLAVADRNPKIGRRDPTAVAIAGNYGTLLDGLNRSDDAAALRTSYGVAPVTSRPTSRP